MSVVPRETSFISTKMLQGPVLNQIIAVQRDCLSLSLGKCINIKYKFTLRFPFADVGLIVNKGTKFFNYWAKHKQSISINFLS